MKNFNINTNKIKAKATATGLAVAALPLVVVGEVVQNATKAAYNIVSYCNDMVEVVKKA